MIDEAEAHVHKHLNEGDPFEVIQVYIFQQDRSLSREHSI